MLCNCSSVISSTDAQGFDGSVKDHSLFLEIDVLVLPYLRIPALINHGASPCEVQQNCMVLQAFSNVGRTDQLSHWLVVPHCETSTAHTYKMVRFGEKYCCNFSRIVSGFLSCSTLNSNCFNTCLQSLPMTDLRVAT